MGLQATSHPKDPGRQWAATSKWDPVVKDGRKPGQTCGLLDPRAGSEERLKARGAWGDCCRDQLLFLHIRTMLF